MKLMIFDLDGTLLDTKTHTISENVVKAIRQVKKKGIYVILATGRHIATIDPFILELIEFDAFVTVNGNIILDKNRKVISDYPMDLKITQDIFNISNSSKLEYAIQSENGIHAPNKNSIIETIETLHRHNQGIRIDAINCNQLKSCYCFMLYVSDVNHLHEIIKKYPSLKIESFYQNCYDIYGASINKTTGIDVVLSMFKLNWDDAVVFGDSINDVQMLTKAKTAYIVDNGTGILDHLDVPKIHGGPLSDEFSKMILKYSNTSMIDLSSDDVLLRMKDNRLKMTCLISFSFFVFSIQSLFIRQNSMWILYLPISATMALFAYFIIKKSKVK